MATPGRLCRPPLAPSARPSRGWMRAALAKWRVAVLLLLFLGVLAGVAPGEEAPRFLSSLAVIRVPGRVADVAFDPTGTRLAILSSGGLQVWQVDTGRPLSPPMPEKSVPPRLLRFSGDGRRLVCATESEVHVWDAGSARLLCERKLEGASTPSPDAGTYDVDLAAKLLACRKGDRSVEVWNLDRGVRVRELRHLVRVEQVVLAGDGRRVATLCADKTVWVWRLDNGASFRLQRAGSVAFVELAPRGGRLLTWATEDSPSTVTMWNLDTGLAISKDVGVDGASFSPDGRFLVVAPPWSSAEGGRSVTFCRDAATGSLVGAPMSVDEGSGRLLTGFGPRGQLLQARFVPEGDSSARLWDLRSGRPLSPPIRVRAFPPACVGAGGRFAAVVAAGGQESEVRVWEAVATSSGAPWLCGRILGAAFSPGGRQVITASDDHTARLWDAVSGRLLGTLHGHQGALVAVRFSPDGRWIATASDDGTARLWDATSGKPRGAPLRHAGPVRDLAFAPDGSRLATASGDSARLWEVPSGRLVCRTGKVGTPVLQVLLASDGRLVTVSHGSPPRLWDTVTGRPARLPSVLPRADLVALSPKGDRAVSASSHYVDTDSSIGRNMSDLSVWSTRTGQVLWKKVDALDGRAAALSFSPDGRRVVLGTDYGSVSIFDAGSGEVPAIEEYLGQGGLPVTAAVFSPDGSRLATGGKSGTAGVFVVAGSGPVPPPLEPGGPVLGVVWSPDGASVLTVSREDAAGVLIDRLSLWRARDGGLLWRR